MASKVTNEEEEEVLEELEQLHREALGLPDVPIHILPQQEPVGKIDEPAVAVEQEGERQAILA